MLTKLHLNKSKFSNSWEYITGSLVNREKPSHGGTGRVRRASKYSELNGISAKEYLEKARKLFTEMNLQWDLDELDKIGGSH